VTPTQRLVIRDTTNIERYRQRSKETSTLMGNTVMRVGRKIVASVTPISSGPPCQGFCIVDLLKMEAFYSL
jgi:hypothetical protein